ncbi:hypothetical protein PA598K_05397 [Paenibacillus sp. 598K]|nr:hypothetical protein PA598K_05397 [Paenibacillus sp. 598K]
MEKSDERAAEAVFYMPKSTRNNPVTNRTLLAFFTYDLFYWAVVQKYLYF